jgi:hypothetical protein
MTTLVNREFLGYTLADPDLTNRGRYKVHIPELQPHMKETEGIWAKNYTHNWRVTPSRDGVYGSYYPLHSGTLVVVKFEKNDYNTAYIDRIISDYAPQSLPFKTVDRDEYYQIIRTPRTNSLIAICESTTDKPADSIHIYYNNKKVTIVLDSSGININVTGDVNIKSSGNANIQSGGNTNIKSGGLCNVQSAGVTNVKAGGDCNIDAPTINLNCGAAGEASAAASPTLIDTSQEYDYFKQAKG